MHHRDKGYLKDKNWRELCEAASREHNPEKLLELITALNNALEQKEKEEKATRSRTMVAREEELLSRRNVNIVAA